MEDRIGKCFGPCWGENRPSTCEQGSAQTSHRWWIHLTYCDPCRECQESSLEFIIKAHMKQKIIMGLNAGYIFWQANVSEASSKFVTSNTAFECYKVKRVPFGISSFPGYF